MRVAILGCGYVGLELGRQLTAAGHEPIGVRRSEAGLDAIRAAGFEAVAADLTEESALADVPDVDAVVFAASTGGGGAEAARDLYVDGLRTTIRHVANRDTPPDRLLYTSSTGVYGDHGGDWVDEETPLEPQTEKTEVLCEAERVVETAANWGMKAGVVRFAGLYGPERYRLARYLDRPVTEGYRNLLHRDDAAGILTFLLTRDDAPPSVVLGVDNEPVHTWAFADWLAEACGVDPPAKRTRESRLAEADLSERARRRVTTSKRCSNAFLRELGYEFAVPTFRAGYRPAIEAYRASE